MFTMHKQFSSQEEIATIDRECRCAGIGCVDCKKMLAENMIRHLTPIRERAAELRADMDYVRDVLKQGAERCDAIAQETMSAVRKAMGLCWE